MRGRDGEEEEAAAVRGSLDGEVEEAEKGLVGEVPFLLGDPPWLDEDSLASSCIVLRGDWDKPGDCDLLEEGNSLLEGDCSGGFCDRPGGLAGLEDVLGSSGKLENS